MFGWDRNLLRRRTDRLEAAMVAGLIVLFLIAMPVLATVAGRWTSEAGIRQQHAEASWRQVPATVVPSLPGQRDNAVGPADTVWVRARWTGPDGQARTDWIPVSPRTAVGSSTRVWVSRSGSLTRSPLRAAQLQDWIATAELLTGCVLAFVLCLVGLAGRFLLGRRRLADWDRAWQVAAPRWTRQR